MPKKTHSPEYTPNNAFVARGLRSAEKARKENRYVSADTVLAQLKLKLAAARRQA